VRCAGSGSAPLPRRAIRYASCDLVGHPVPAESHDSPCPSGRLLPGTARRDGTSNAIWMTTNAKPYGAEGLDPDNPDVHAAIDLVRWELSLWAGGT
jgi:hypothetical protein